MLPRGLPRSRCRARRHPPNRFQKQHGLHPPPRNRRSASYLRRDNRRVNRLPPGPRRGHSRRRSKRRPPHPIRGVLLPPVIRIQVTSIRLHIPVSLPRGQDNILNPVFPLRGHLEQARHRTAHQGQRLGFLHLTRRPIHILTRHRPIPRRGPLRTPQDRSRRSLMDRSLTDRRRRWCPLIPPSTRCSLMQPESHARRCVRAASLS